MRGSLRFPIRLKILLALLVVVTTVVSLITFTMANLFHEDKMVYIKDLTSVTAIGAAEECRSILLGYTEQLKHYARVMRRKDYRQDQKAEFMEGYFEDFEDLIAVSLYENGAELASIYDVGSLEEAGLSKDSLIEYRAKNPIPPQEIQSGSFWVQNSTLSERLPTFTLAFTRTFGKGEPPVVIAATIRLDKLMRLASRSGVFDLFVVDADGVLLAHPNPRLVAERASADLRKEMESTGDGFSAGITVEYEREGREFVGGFAGAGIGRVMVGAEIPKSAAYLASRDLLKRLIMMALLLLVMAALGSLLGSRRLTRPMERLCEATRDIAGGQFETRLEIRSNDEIGTLASSFNEMALGLKQREEALRQAQAQLIQSEKMAAFGQIGAGIAHEVKNPLAGILGCAQLSLRKTEKDTPFHKNLLLIEKETKRCKNIIENLLRFARQEKTVQKPTDVNSFVEDAVQILNHQLELTGIKLEKDLAEGLPLICGNANQLQQVLMNLVINSQQAMEDRSGTVVICTRNGNDGQIEIEIRDDGPGMSEEVRGKIFEPFFTTKRGGKGTGLGLSVSYGIIKEHDGEISVRSGPGQGTTFTIRLPSLERRAESKQGERQIA